MGVILGDLYHHQGYPDRRLPNGRLAGGVWTWSTRQFIAYVAACGCGWRASQNHPPTDQGAQAALDHWRDTHATPLLDRKASGHRSQLGRQLRWLGTQADRPACPRPGNPPAARPGTAGPRTLNPPPLHRVREQAHGH